MELSLTPLFTAQQPDSVYSQALCKHPFQALAYVDLKCNQNAFGDLYPHAQPRRTLANNTSIVVRIAIGCLIVSVLQETTGRGVYDKLVLGRETVTVSQSQYASLTRTLTAGLI